ncbi:hypothetical protein [Shewanella putrefaciens]|uniref:Uncharacterized protein n=1 Tax=Shewanella putrefaciens TaxID=24 RepID=A0ABX8X849_SHEPU|nr:hypothetical protein [Shewanella putrefaciens]AVV81959.1 hypothetical protein SPWS13_0088 [Shewanella putrefaciens]MCT8943741.1 hypothetical protein [Shewanella putrefaciens]QSE47968.1 hypothetical protein JW975_11215 [Shewanella putrefaciens]QYX71371.1 hypothetical protein K3G22_11205 [Shewanella putrefaciens]GGN23344.1 hypothetical protein GCM10007984_24010 [Shewanella putrefaciens]
MSKVHVKGGVNTGFYQALIAVDVDINAESILIFDRYIYKYIFMLGNLSGGGTKNIIVPYSYVTKNDLVVAITDRDLVYSIATADGVQPQVIDGSVTNILP